MAKNEYKYRKLASHEIRLLKPLPGDDLHFQLVHANLDDHNDYAALSYTWGGTLFPRAINLDNGICRVTENLHDALEALKARHTLKILDLEPKYLWVDAVCINQADLLERSSQVRLMRRIYEQARRVFVWLGKPENDSQIHLAAQKLEEFGARWRHKQLEIRPFTLNFWTRKAITLEDDLAAFLSGISSDMTLFDVEGSPTHDAWLGINWLWRNPYWNRTWIFQESTVYDDQSSLILCGITTIEHDPKVILLCGRSSITWFELVLAIYVVFYLQGIPTPGTAFMKNAWEPFGKVYDLRLFRAWRLPFSFLRLLEIFRHTQCQDPRDKVYAPLALAQSQVADQIKVDYARPVFDVYFDVARACLGDQGHELDFLGSAMKLTTGSSCAPSAECMGLKWPSWLPNWDQPLELVPIPKSLYLTPKEKSFHLIDRRGVPGPEDKAVNAYNASKGSHIIAHIDQTRLNIQGVRCGTIKDLQPLTGANAVEMKREKLSTWDAAAKSRYITGEVFMVAMMKTEAMDLKYDSLCRVIGRNGTIDLKQPIDLDSKPYAWKMRSLCMTDEGYVGVVPESAQVGDLVCVLLGSQVLYTLRYAGSGNEYEYIGECYIHSLMDGEVMEWVKKGISQVENFVLV